MSKAEFLNLITAKRDEWDALVTGIAPERMTEKGATGDWSVKDVIAHLTVWEEKPIAMLEARQGRGVVKPRPWPDEMSTDEANDWIYKANQDRSLQELLAQSRRVHGRLLELVQAMPEKDLYASDLPDLEGGTLADYIASDTYDHYREHTVVIRAWLEQTAPQMRSG